MPKKHLSLIIFLILVIITLIACDGGFETKESSIWERRQVEYSRITTDNTPVRSGLGNNFEIVRELQSGQEVDVIGEIGNWYIVRLDDDSLGSIEEDKATPIIKPDEELTEEEEADDTVEGSEEEKEEDVQPVDNLQQNEQQMVNLVNQARAENNLQPLEIDGELTRVARIKSADMVENNYFSHHSPTYGSPFDMLDHYNIEYLHAGENIAANPSIENAHNSLMDSPGHRQNILNPNYTHLGIGIKASQQYGYIITQLFISKPR